MVQDTHSDTKNAAHKNMHNKIAQTPRIKEITSPSNPVIKKIKSLFLKKNRDEYGLFISEGLRHALGAIEAGWKIDSLIFDRNAKTHPKLQEILQTHTDPQTEFIETTPAIMAKLTKRDNAQSVLAVIHKKQRNFSEIELTDNEGLYVLLDNIRDPGNLGTILRTVEGCGAQGVILAGQCCDPYSLESIRASMGSFPFVPFYGIDDNDLLPWLADQRARNVEIIGTHLKTDTNYANHPYKFPTILIMGNEQAGMREILVEYCTKLVKIPMHGTADSLNVAVATGIMLYEIVKNKSL